MTDLAALLTDDAAREGGRAAWLGWAAACPDPEAARIAALAAGGKVAEAEGRHGAIACGAPEATRIGMALLRAGGNAADAAAGAAFAMMVADPPNASPAGRAHILWDRPGAPAQAIDGATSAPGRLPDGLDHLPDARALPIPGAVRAILTLHDTAGRLPLAVVAAPARDLALDGFDLPEPLARIWAWRAPEIADPDARRVYLPGGAAPPAGARFVQPGLAAFFDRLIATGRDPFADPDFAADFARRLSAKGAFWRAEDLIAADPLPGETVAWDGPSWRLTSIGRQGWGHTLLRIVSLAASAGSRTPVEAEIAHLLAILRAFEERPEELRSLKPKPDPIPWETLRARLGEDLGPDWRAPPTLRRAVARARIGGGEERDTTHLSVVDRDGMRVALTQSIGPHFGARVADPETGILIAHSYRMAEAPEPRARDVTEQCPCLLDLGPARHALGGAGSERIPGAVAAVIRGLLEGHGLAAAITAPRANWVGDTVRLHVDAPPGLEDRLAAAGAGVAFTGRGPVDHLGIVQAAGRDDDGRVSAAADPAYAGTAAAE
jgi:gamma-glutamyltranspeptidase